MAPSLDETLASLSAQIICRELQIRQLASLLDPNFPSLSNLVVHGVEATGKSLVVDSVLTAIGTPSVLIRSRECITTRHLLERTIAVTKEAFKKQSDEERVNGGDGRCESISAFVIELQSILEGKGKFILVFDGIDCQRDAVPTLLPAIARLGEIIPGLTTIFIVTNPQPHALHHSSVPHIHFTPYTRADTLSILSTTPLSVHVSPPSSQTHDTQIAINTEDAQWLWTRFISAVWDSLGQSAARDVVSFREICSRLWKPFIQPILDGHYGARESSKLMVRNKGLFQSEAALVDSIVPVQPTAPKSEGARPPTHALPYYPCYLLISAYLASHNLSKHDITLFSRTSLSKRRKKGGGTALTAHRVSKHRKISRKLLGPQLFTLERLFAILHAILPQYHGGGGADAMCQLATLIGLRLIVKSGGAGDILEGGVKWRVNVGWEYVRSVAREVRFDIESYLVEG